MKTAAVRLTVSYASLHGVPEGKTLKFRGSVVTKIKESPGGYNLFFAPTDNPLHLDVLTVRGNAVLTQE